VQLGDQGEASTHSLGTLGDRELLARVGEHDDRAFRALFERYGPHALALASAILADAQAVDDVMMSAFRDIWRSPAAYAADGRTVRSRVMQSVHEKAIERARHTQASEPHRALRPVPTAHATPAPPRRDPGFDGDATMRTLPMEQRRVIELLYLSGLSITQVSARLGMTTTSVTKHMTAGMRALRDMR
jgi:RNA polymerase sigma-70 factor (ECF subfamily)